MREKVDTTHHFSAWISSMSVVDRVDVDCPCRERVLVVLPALNPL